ncbi:unnamed protein product [Tetraodon nigroviridis]|uniref:(spotted green pufferfish) hypothetical protein n=1 Tax=Tetraodon nigroviridis TaxID=99883 RepID=Q4RSV7_TETNG|nr:unnamed protein product [Tetraodon nigroviridis]
MGRQVKSAVGSGGRWGELLVKASSTRGPERLYRVLTETCEPGCQIIQVHTRRDANVPVTPRIRSHTKASGMQSSSASPFPSFVDSGANFGRGRKRRSTLRRVPGTIAHRIPPKEKSCGTKERILQLLRSNPKPIAVTHGSTEVRRSAATSSGGTDHADPGEDIEASVGWQWPGRKRSWAGYPPLLRVRIPGIGSAPSVTFSPLGCLSEISRSRFSSRFSPRRRSHLGSSDV